MIYETGGEREREREGEDGEITSNNDSSVHYQVTRGIGSNHHFLCFSACMHGNLLSCIIIFNNNHYFNKYFKSAK